MADATAEPVERAAEPDGAYPPDGPWWPTEKVAEHYGKEPSTIRYWRLISYGPRGAKCGRDVLYPPSEIRRFDAELRVEAGLSA